MNKIRKAILQAADRIETRPDDFSIMGIGIPNEKSHCASPGCILGWIGAYYGLPPSGCGYHNVLEYLGLEEAEHFYMRMQAVNEETLNEDTFGQWSRNAADCARVARLYADKYHPEIVV